MRAIEHLPRSKQIKKSKETIELYGPLALRIGMQDIRSELEDLAFRCIHPLRATMLESAIKKSSGCLLYTSPSPRDLARSRMPSSA